MVKLKEGNIGAASEIFQMIVEFYWSSLGLMKEPMLTFKVNTYYVGYQENIEFVVAPYEVDAQLAHMCQLGVENGGVVAVITQDSDLIAYGCPAIRTPPILGFEQIIFNIDRHGNGERIELEKVFSTKSGRSLFQSFNMKLLTGTSSPWSQRPSRKCWNFEDMYPNEGFLRSSKVLRSISATLEGTVISHNRDLLEYTSYNNPLLVLKLLVRLEFLLLLDEGMIENGGRIVEDFKVVEDLKVGTLLHPPCGCDAAIGSRGEGETTSSPPLGATVLLCNARVGFI
ncbi:hypothetical protein JHK84_035608 [Glycine max]|nr:hypothetical protein JHK84_035608 [Glycine max]